MCQTDRAGAAGAQLPNQKPVSERCGVNTAGCGLPDPGAAGGGAQFEGGGCPELGSLDAAPEHRRGCHRARQMHDLPRCVLGTQYTLSKYLSKE